MGALANKSAGFSVVELMVAMAVAAILIGVGLPAFNGFVAQQRLTTYTNDLVAAISYARSEAAKLGGQVSVQAMNLQAGNEWGGGYCVVVGNPGDCTGATLRSIEAPTAVTLDAIGNLHNVGTLRFNSRGVLVGNNGGAIQICSTDTAVGNGRTLNVSVIGRTLTQDLTCHGGP